MKTLSLVMVKLNPQPHSDFPFIVKLPAALLTFTTVRLLFIGHKLFSANRTRYFKPTAAFTDPK